MQAEKGAAADALRQTLPVPVFALDLDRTLRHQTVRATGAGVPVIVTEDDAPAPGSRRGRPRANVAPELFGDRSPEPVAAAEDGPSPRTIFDGDDRFIFQDHTYPFRTVGRVSNSQGSCSGTLVGPRHLLTASHCVVWNSDGTTGWLKFEASSFDAFNLGVAWAIRVYHYRQVVGPTIGDQDIAFDFVVVVLDTRLGDTLGWMGGKTYDGSWNGGAHWANIGYPFDRGGTTQPVFQQGCAVTDTASQCFNGWCALELFSRCDIMQGQSGSALYGFWDNVPHVVAVTSAENRVTNLFGGGALLPTLINQARTELP